MKNLFVLLFLLVSASTVTGQELNLNEPLSINPKIKKGVLPNGLTYYIYKTDVVKNVASYYIIQNVGSILENDDQQGLAHFLEHMAFNGTKSFPGKGVLNTLQKHGAVFAKDINAYTAFDETVYNMDNIPTNVPGLIDTSLLILHDWADDLLLTDAEIDAERGVIKEEWRTRQNGYMRLFKKSLPTVYNNTKYADRMPIGLMSIVDNFKYKTLRDFYHDWYRTDLQAIAVVGDFDEKDMEQKIIKLFSPIKAIKNPIERVVTAIPDNEKMLYNLGTDKEVSTSFISFSINQPKSLKDKTVGDFKQAVYNGMVSRMINSRLNDIAQKPDAPFISANCSYQTLARAKSSFGLQIAPKPNMQKEAFKVAIQELNKAVKFGFTQGEIDRTMAFYENYFQTKISKIDQIPHAEIVNSIQKNYLDNEAMMDKVKEFDLIKSIFSTMTAANLQSHLQKLYTTKNRVLDVTGVETEENLSEKDALQLLSEIENDQSLTAYADEFVGKTLTDGLIIKVGKIVSQKTNKEIGSTAFVLSNGITVNYKYTAVEKNNVLVEAASFGGNSLIKDADLPSAAMVSNLAKMSGVGNYSAADLSKVLVGKNANTRIGIADLEENISGMATTKDVETLLQLIHLQFVQPRFDADSYKVLQESLNSNLMQRANDNSSKMEDSITTILYGANNPKKRLFNEQYLKDISLEKIKSVYKERFSNAGDFTFYITGDISKESLKPLLEKYIASLPTTKNREKWQDNSVSWLNNTTKKEVFMAMEDPKATVRMAFKSDLPFSLKTKYVLKAFQDMLELRLSETLREQEGGTYGASVYSSLNKRPKQVASFYVYFDCDPEKVDKLVGIVHEEIEKFKKGDIDTEDLEKVRSSFLKEVTEEQQYTDHELNLMYDYIVEGYNKNDPKNNADLIKAIAPQDIQKFVTELTKNDQSFEIIFKPKK